LRFRDQAYAMNRQLRRLLSSLLRSRATRSGLVLLIGLTASLDAATRVVTACGHHDYPPWNWQRGNEIVGACADVTRNLFEHLGHTVKLAYVGPWKRCQAMIEAGTVDINICSFKNPEREAYSRFIDVPMGLNPIAVFVKKGHEFPFSHWSDLAGRRSGIVNGVSMGPEFDGFLAKQTRLDTAVDPISNWRKLDAGRIDFVPVGLEAGALQIRLYGFAGRITPLPTPALEGKLYISISNKSTDLHPLIPAAEKYLSAPERQQELKNLLHQYHELYINEAAKPTVRPSVQ
jgi:polar amino acid transport system substrate-binding protein